MKSLQHTSFKTMLQYTPEEIKYFLDLAAKLKADKKAGKEILITNALRALICSGVTSLMRTLQYPINNKIKIGKIT